METIPFLRLNSCCDWIMSPFFRDMISTCDRNNNSIPCTLLIHIVGYFSESLPFIGTATDVLVNPFPDIITKFEMTLLVIWRRPPRIPDLGLI